MNEISRFEDRQTEDGAGKVPHDIEAEQQLLGALLTDNDVYNRIDNLVGPHHFYDPVHADIFREATQKIANNALASPVTLRPVMETHEGLKQLGGPQYLLRLAGAAIATFAARDYAVMIRDLAMRRRLIRIGGDMTARAGIHEADNEPSQQIVKAEQELYELAEEGGSARGFQSFLSAVRDAVQVANAAYMRDTGRAARE
jgi:replicative DNA helicase